MINSPALYRLRAAACACVLLVAGTARAEVSGASAATACTPSFSSSGPDAEAYGAARNYPLGTIADRRRQDHMVATFSNFDKLLPAHAVAPPAAPSPLGRNCDHAAWHYDFDGERRTIDQYLA
ncbi:MAG TPA: serine hydrolase, partial [Afipia sp.]